MSHDFLRNAMYRMRTEDDSRAVRDAKWREEQELARATKEAGLNFARLTMEAPEFLGSSLGRLNKNSVYRLVHLLAITEGIDPFMSHLNTMNDVALFREAALLFKNDDCLRRLMKITANYHDFEELSQFSGKTPEAREDEKGQKKVVASDFIDWAVSAGWVLPENSASVETASELQVTAPVARLAAQEAAIIAAIKGLNYDPKALPKVENGRAGPRAKVWGEVSSLKTTFSSKKVYESAWQKMRDAGDIADQE